MKSMYIYIYIYRCIICCLTTICYIYRPASLLSLRLVFFIPSPLHWYPHSSNSFYMSSTILSVCIILLLSSSSRSLLMFGLLSSCLKIQFRICKTVKVQAINSVSLHPFSPTIFHISQFKIRLYSS